MLDHIEDYIIEKHCLGSLLGILKHMTKEEIEAIPYGGLDAVAQEKMNQLVKETFITYDQIEEEYGLSRYKVRQLNAKRYNGNRLVHFVRKDIEPQLKQMKGEE